jgi:hypothetical protein
MGRRKCRGGGEGAEVGLVLVEEQNTIAKAPLNILSVPESVFPHELCCYTAMEATILDAAAAEATSLWLQLDKLRR